MVMMKALRFLMILCLLMARTLATWAQNVPLVEAVKVKGAVTFCGEVVPLELPQVRERLDKAMLIALGDSAQTLLWIKRAPRYLPIIEEALKADGMPEDLKYVAVAESALRPHAGSPKGAMGFWQLIPETASKYGLRVDEFMDERRNIFLSTPAAMRFLQALHERFSSWTLAVAAYNMGKEGLAAEMLEQSTRDYYNLYLPLETQQFIFRILAVKMILSDPKRYGFDVKPEDRYRPLTFDTVDVDCFQETPIRLVAQAAGTYFKTIKDLNPHVRGHYLQPGHHQINLPPGKADGFESRFLELAKKHRDVRETRIYEVREGDSLSAIAERFEVPLAALLIWNRIGLNDPIHPGDRLVIYPGTLDPIE
jgi:membrane-bound lytic murein transglycosylase D